MECKGGNERKKTNETKKEQIERNKREGTKGKDRNERIEMKGTK